jgi:DNA invertase Pin-like site-specific DNA recombinase
MKFAVYVRVSKIDMNPENQQLQLEKHCSREGWEYDLYVEKESTRNTRPVKEEVMQKLRMGEYDGVLIWKLDRWGRSLTELVENLQELTQKNIKIISLMDNIDYTSTSGKLFANMLCCFADYERAIIRDRTMAGLERAKAQGKSLGRPAGSKDKKERRKSGYWQRYAGKANKRTITKRV